MGYYTKYTLKVEPNNKKVDIDEIMSAIRSENEELHYAINEFGGTCEPSNWCDWFDDMKKISINYLETIFILTGEGEESGDLWKAYFKNGKGYKSTAKIIYEKYDESKLK